MSCLRVEKKTHGTLKLQAIIFRFNIFVEKAKQEDCNCAFCVIDESKNRQEINNSKVHSTIIFPSYEQETTINQLDSLSKAQTSTGVVM